MMSTPHNRGNIGDFAKTVLMPGDPLRAKYIAENFLSDYKLVNQVRGMYAYTGNYKGITITVMASGMGMPSMGIYCYELYKFYDVDLIIRIGSCGGYKEDLNLFDIILTENVYSESNFALTFNNDDCHVVSANSDANKIIFDTSKQINIPVVCGNTICTDCFDLYMSDVDKFLDRFPKNSNIIGAEMEAFSLFYIANYLNKKAACLMSVVDSKHISRQVSASERQTGLNNMILLALESCLNFKELK